MKLSPKSYSVHNNMEEVADLAIRRVLSDDKTACTCPLCVSDMKTLVLNKLKPDYIPVLRKTTAEKQKEPIKLETLDRYLFNKVMMESYRAMAMVKAQPRHDSERSPLKNGIEEILLLAVQEILPSQDPKWQRHDNLSRLMALALNELEPKYSTTYKGIVYSRTAEIDAAYLAKVYAVIYNAVQKLNEETSPVRG